VDSNRSRCWAIKGSKPIKFTSGSKAKIHIGGFYTENGEFYWYDLGIKQNTDSFLKSLIKFNRDIGARILLLLDRAPWHKSKKAQEFFQKNNHCKLSQNHFEFYNWVVPRFNTSFILAGIH